MANGAINFKNNSGNIVSFISGSGSDIIISGGTLNLSNMTGLTLGNLTMEGTVETASFAPSYLLTSSFNTYSGTTNTVIGTLQTSTASLNTRISTIEGVTGSYATTGSNIFKSSQTITGSLFVSENLVIAGSSSIQYISSSIVNIDDNIITVNAMNPSVRFGGLSVIDSGSSPQVSGSMLFDSINNQWIFVHQNQSSVTSSVLLMGPETYDNLGNEAYITANRLVKSTGIEHLSDSNITDTGTKVSINSTTEVTGSFIVTGNVGIGTNNPLSKFHVNTGTNQNFRVRPGTDVGATNGVVLNSRTDDDGSLQQLTLRASDVIMLPSGNVGIGTATPSYPLEVFINSSTTYATSSRGNVFRVYNSNTSANVFAGIELGGAGTANDGLAGINGVVTGSGNGALTFYTRNSNTFLEKMRINSDGNVGIGTSSPSTTFNVGHESHGIGIAYMGGSALPAIAGLFTDTSSGQQGYGSLLIKSRSDYAGYSINFYTAASANTPLERMRITSGGNTEIRSGNSLLVYNAANTRSGYLTTSSNGTELSSHNGSAEPLILIAPDSTATIRFYTAGSTVANERMRITSSGITIVGHTAGVGTNFSPPIQVKGGAGIGNGFGIISGNNEMVGGLQLNSSSTNSLNITADPDNLRSSSEIGFSVDGTERMRITSDGKVIVRQSNFTYPVSIEAQSGGGQLALTRSGAYTEFYMGGTTGGGTQLYVRSGGSGGVRLDAGSTGWVADSDIRLKDIEKPIENAVESLSTLQTVYYSWKDSENEKQHLGLIAQEVESVFPEIVSESSITGMKGVNYIELIPVLVKAIQELKAELEIAKAEIQTLKQ
jgi:hypothetical protein